MSRVASNEVADCCLEPGVKCRLTDYDWWLLFRPLSQSLEQNSSDVLMIPSADTLLCSHFCWRVYSLTAHLYWTGNCIVAVRRLKTLCCFAANFILKKKTVWRAFVGVLRPQSRKNVHYFWSLDRVLRIFKPNKSWHLIGFIRDWTYSSIFLERYSSTYFSSFRAFSYQEFGSSSNIGTRCIFMSNTP